MDTVKLSLNRYKLLTHRQQIRNTVVIPAYYICTVITEFFMTSNRTGPLFLQGLFLSPANMLRTAAGNNCGFCILFDLCGLVIKS